MSNNFLKYVFCMNVIIMLRRVFGYESGPVASALRIGVKTVVMYCLVKPFLDAII
jgi:hypothetical protein